MLLQFLHLDCCLGKGIPDVNHSLGEEVLFAYNILLQGLLEEFQRVSSCRGSALEDNKPNWF